MKSSTLIAFVTVLFAMSCASPRSDKSPSTRPAQRATATDDENHDEWVGPRPTLVDENAPTEIVEERYPGGELWKRVEGKRTKDGEFVPHGLTTTWYESGTKWTETQFRNGVPHGTRQTWYTTGAEWSYGTYDNGIEHGTWTAYHPNGEKAREWTLDHGVWNGPYIEWHPNGRKRIEVMFVDGIRQGLSTLYDEEGRVAAVTDFIDGVEQP